jgi:hypothetical protein
MYMHLSPDSNSDADVDADAFEFDITLDDISPFERVGNMISLDDTPRAQSPLKGVSWTHAF